jgi:hypothetical protein
VDSGVVKRGAELSTAAGGACDETAAAVGHSGRATDFILCGLLKGQRQAQIGLL